jgi:hypothetical protein
MLSLLTPDWYKSFSLRQFDRYAICMIWKSLLRDPDPLGY